MDQQKSKMTPNYQLIYFDLVNAKFPHKKDKCKMLLNKKEITGLDIIILNKILFGKNDRTNQRLRSYSRTDILEILNYQIKYQLNNTQLSAHFGVSKNSITKWKRKVYSDLYQ